MAEPLLATLAERGERLDGGGAALGRAGLPRDAARWPRSIELPFAHGRLDWAARRRVAARCATASTSPTCCRTRSSRRCCRGSRASRGASATAAKAARRCSTGACRNPAGRPPMVAFYGALAGAAFDDQPAPAPAPRAGACSTTTTARHGAAARALLGLRAGRRIRPGQALAGGALRRRSRARCTPPTARRSCCSARPAKPSCAPRSRRRPATPAASSPAARRCSTRWR